MNPFKIYYLASPHSHVSPLMQKIYRHKVTYVASELLKNKIPVISPIVHNVEIIEQTQLSFGWEHWKFLDEALLKACGNLLVLKLDGWEKSKGIQAEINFAKTHGIPITEIRFEDLETFIYQEKQKRRVLDAEITNGEDNDWINTLPGIQLGVSKWVDNCFGQFIAKNHDERNHRFLEEALELVQACDYTQEEAHRMVDYVYGREKGEVEQEIAGSLITLLALASAHNVDINHVTNNEMQRVWQNMERIRSKQKSKPADISISAKFSF